MRYVGPRFLHARSERRTLDGKGNLIELEATCAVSGEMQRYIRKQLGLLRMQMQRFGLKFVRTPLRTMPDGTQVEFIANLNGPQPVLLARVFAVSQEEEAVYVCELRSGLFSVVGYTLGTITPSAVFGYQFVTGEGGAWKRSDSFSVSGRFARQFVYDPLNSAQLYRYAAPTKRGSCFSGTMRRAVQLLAGMNEAIPYQYTWPVTHGVYVNASDPQNVRYWVIEISADGVTAGRMRMCDGALPTGTTFLPLPVTNIPKDRTLAGSSVMAPAYEGSPLSFEIGWAFSEHGHEAQNVVVKSGFGPGALYRKSFRYKVAITADAQGDPDSAVLTEEQSGWYWTNHIQNHVRVPAFLACGLASVREDMRYGVAAPPTAEDYEFPVHVYYTGNEVVAFSYGYSQTRVTTIPAEWPAGSPDNPYGPYFPTECQRQGWGYTDYWMKDFFHDGGSRTEMGARLVGAHGANTEAYNKSSSSGAWIVRQLAVGVGPIASMVDAGQKANVVFSEGYVVHKYVAYDSNGAEDGKNYFFSFIIPFFEREGYFFHQRTGYTMKAAQRMYQRTYMGAGTAHEPLLGSSWINSASAVGCLEESRSPRLWAASPPDPYEFSHYVSALGSAGAAPVGNMGFCETELGAKYVQYPLGDSMLSECGAWDYTGEWLNYQVDSFVFVLGADAWAISGYETEAGDILYSGSLTDDPASCTGGSPIWLGAWLDAFTGNGFVTAHPRSEISADPAIFGLSEYLGNEGRVKEYLVEGMPAERRASGWFGVPFPEDVQ